MSQKKKTTKKRVSKKSESSKKLENLTHTNGKVYDQDTDQIRKLEEILEVKTTNPFGTSNAKVFEENLSSMNLSEMQEIAVRAGIFPSGSQAMLKNKLSKSFKNPLKSMVLASTTTNFRSAFSAFLSDNLIPFFSISSFESRIPAVSEIITG